MTGELFTPEENEIIWTVARFVKERVRPYVQQMEREGEYPRHLVNEMMELGLFGLAVPESLWRTWRSRSRACGHPGGARRRMDNAGCIREQP